MNLTDEVSSKRERSEEGAMDGETVKNLLETGVLDVFRWEDDDLALRAAASHSRLPYDRMTAQEIGCFSDIAESKASVNLYLFIRNKILQMWQLESNVELTTEDSFEAMPVPYNSDRSLVRRVHGFLQRYGFINFGNFHRLTSCKMLVGSKKKRVIIIGAGAAGIAAAKQLFYFGFDVAVIEARKRVGGRVHTYRQRDSNIVADLGAMIVTGINGNPMVTIMRQVQCTPVRIKTPCAIYDEYGKLVDQRKDELVEEAFKKIGDTAAYIAHHLNIDEIDGKKLSLADAYDNIISLLELRMQRRRLKFWELYEEVLMKMKQVQDEMILYKKSAEYLAEKMKGMEAVSSLTGDARIEQEILRKCYRRDLGEAIKRYDAASERVKSLDMTLSNLKKQEPSEVYMNQRDRRLLDFHFANLEFANGTNLEQLSLKHWDQDDDFELSGSHMAFRDGYGELITRLVTAELNERIQLNSVVELIEYDKDGVTVAYRHDGNLEKIHGDVCVCTLPLGVLKRSIQGATEAPEFSPPLPDNKINAIGEMGFGNLNKIVLIFDRPFWDTTQNFFGHLNHSKVARGEMFLFVSMFNTPVLIALMAGEAANLEAPNEIIVKKAMSVLANIFGSACPKGPLEAVITRWHNDPYATGCYSYIAKDTDGSGSQLDVLAETVGFRIKDGSYAGEPRIYFAGEHTNKCYPATVQGAWMSGIREAAKIADLFLGCPFSRKAVLVDPECVLLDSDDDSETCKDDSTKTTEATTEIKVNGHADQIKRHKSTKAEEPLEEIIGIKATEYEKETERNGEQNFKEEASIVIEKKELNGEPEAKRRKED